MSFSYLEFGFGFPGHEQRHPDPPDDHRLLDIRVTQWNKDDDASDDRGRPLDESAAPESLPLWPLEICQSAYCEIQDYFRSRKPEAAGILLGPATDDPVISHFVPDEDGEGTPGSFQLNAVGLNHVLQSVKPARLDLKGFCHSHPSGFIQPSSGDLDYLQRLFDLPANAAAHQCFMPIVSAGRFYPWVYARGRLWLAELILV